MEADKAFIEDKLGVSLDEFKTILKGENKSYADYKNAWWLIQLGTVVPRTLGAKKKKFR